MEKLLNNNLNESSGAYITKLPDNERLQRDVYRSDMDKLRLFTKMLRTNKMLNKVIVTHK